MAYSSDGNIRAGIPTHSTARSSLDRRPRGRVAEVESERRSLRSSTYVPLRLLSGIALLAAHFLIAGCSSHVLVHDERRDEQAKEAKKLVADARVSDTVAALEKSFNDVAALEEARARDRIAYLFDSELRLASRASSLTSKFNQSSKQINGLQTAVEARLGKIGLSDLSPAGLGKLKALTADYTERQKQLDITLVEFRGTVGYPFDNCATVYATSADPSTQSETVSSAFLSRLPEDRRARARRKFPALVDKCKTIDKALAERRKLFAGGVIADVDIGIASIQQDILRYERNMKSAREALSNAATALRESGTPDPTKPATTSKLEIVEVRAKNLTELVHVLSEGSSAFGSGGAHAAAAEKLTRLEAVLGAIAGSSSDSSVKLTEDEKVAVAIVRDIPALADEANKLLTDAKKPRLVPFVAAITQQRLVLEGFEAGQRAKRKQESALRGQFEAVLNEANALAEVLSPLKENVEWSQRSIAQLLDELKGDQKINFLRALSIYADDVKLYRTEAAIWRVRAEAAQYDESLARSKYAAAQWDALSDTIATVLADYHAAGIKQTDLAEFFKALGLVTIGVAVAQ